MKHTPKPLQELDLLDRFLFAEAMEDPVILQHMLEIILGKEITLLGLPQTEKEARRTPLRRFIRMDVWGMDTENAVYDVEVQKENTLNLPKRSRLYQGLLDSNLLPPGSIDFNALNDTYVILIAPFDLFGYELYRYTFQMQCVEVPGLYLDDGAVRIFLNTHGKHPESVSLELVELLRYMEHTSEEVSKECKSGRIQDIQQRVAAIKSSEEIGVKYMQAWEEKVLGEQKARMEGLEEGREEGRLEGREEGRLTAQREAIGIFISEFKTEGFSAEQILEKLRKNYKLTASQAEEFYREFAN